MPLVFVACRAESISHILIWRYPPENVPGWHNHAIRKQKLDGLLAELKFDDRGMVAIGQGRLFRGQDLESLLHAAEIVPEPMADCGLKFIRRRLPSDVAYFIVNHTSEAVDRWIQLASPCRAAVLMDPMTGRTGLAPVRENDEKVEVHLQLEPRETRILRAFAQSGVSGPAWQNVTPVSDPVPVTGEWRVEFIEGGPVLPAGCSTTELKCWTQFGDEEAQRFAGTARYTIMFQIVDQKYQPLNAAVWELEVPVHFEHKETEEAEDKFSVCSVYSVDSHCSVNDRLGRITRAEPLRPQVVPKAARPKTDLGA